MIAITTHVLDTALGKPAAGIFVILSQREGDDYRELGRAFTDSDGRVRQLGPADALRAVSYRLTFETRDYFRATSRDTFFERVTLDFFVPDERQHYHVPVLLSPFGYTTYRGS